MPQQRSDNICFIISEQYGYAHTNIFMIIGSAQFFVEVTFIRVFGFLYEIFLAQY